MGAAYYARAMSHGIVLGVEMGFPGSVHEKMTMPSMKSCKGLSFSSRTGDIGRGDARKRIR